MSELPDTLSFDDVEVPAVTRMASTTAHNPFADVIATLAEAHKAGTPAGAKAFTLPGENSTEKDGNRALIHAGNKLRKAGTDNGVSVRVRTEQVGTRKDPEVLVTFWVVDKITRPRTEATDA